MMAGIAIDSWKLPIFDRHLSQAGYAYEKEKGIGVATDILLLTVITENAVALEIVVRAANNECARTGAPA